MKLANTTTIKGIRKKRNSRKRKIANTMGI
jgi:hypothetical protein